MYSHEANLKREEARKKHKKQRRVNKYFDSIRSGQGPRFVCLEHRLSESFRRACRTLELRSIGPTRRLCEVAWEMTWPVHDFWGIYKGLVLGLYSPSLSLALHSDGPVAVILRVLR